VREGSNVFFAADEAQHLARVVLELTHSFPPSLLVL
jgi:hypothetical protein